MIRAGTTLYYVLYDGFCISSCSQEGGQAGGQEGGQVGGQVGGREGDREGDGLGGRSCVIFRIMDEADASKGVKHPARRTRCIDFTTVPCVLDRRTVGLDNKERKVGWVGHRDEA